MEAAAYLRMLRDKIGDTQDTVGDAIGVSKRQIQNWEGGHSVPGIEHLVYVLRYLGGSLETYIQLLLDDYASDDDIRKLAEHPAEYEDDLEQEVRQRLERLKAKSPALAQQFADYGRFLDEHVQRG